MNWIFYIRKYILDLTQSELADEIYVNQTTVSRSERSESPEPLPRDACVHFIDLVKAKTDTELPVIWFFKTPSSEDVEKLFPNRFQDVEA